MSAYALHGAVSMGVAHANREIGVQVSGCICILVSKSVNSHIKVSKQA